MISNNFIFIGKYYRIGDIKYMEGIMDINIIYEDKFIIVAEKPPKMPCQRDRTGDMDLLTILHNKIKEDDNIRNPYIGLIHRLDRPVGGLIIYAKTKHANSALSKAVQDRQINKEYLAVTCGKPDLNEGIYIDKLLKLSSKNMSIVKDTKDAKDAILEYKTLETVNTEEYGELSLLSIDLKTGRHHQIRVQLSHHNIPIWGDTKYNKSFTNRAKWSQISLWAYKLKFNHPKSNKELIFKSFPPMEFPWNQFSSLTRSDNFDR